MSIPESSTPAFVNAMASTPSAGFSKQRNATLPSIAFAKQLESFFNNRHQSFAAESPNAGNDEVLRALMSNYKRLVQPMLESLLPESALVHISESTHDRSNFLSSTYIRLLTNAWMNNASLLGGHFTPLMMYDYLKPVMTSHLIHKSLAICRPDDYIGTQSWKSVAENIFLGAVEKGDCKTAFKLLDLPGPVIDVNSLVCQDLKFRPETPVERSARLGHHELTKILIIEYGADFNKTPSPSDFCKCGQGGVLEALLSRKDSSMYKQGLLTDLMKVTIEFAGTACTYLVLQALTSSSPLCQHLHMLQARSTCWDWISSGVFHEATFRLDAAAVVPLIDAMPDQRAGLAFSFAYVRDWIYWRRDDHDMLWCDLSAVDSQSSPADLLEYAIRHGQEYESYVFRDPALYPQAIVDIAAQRGDVSLLERMGKWQVLYTTDTLAAAVRSQSIPAIRFLLARGVSAGSFSDHYRTTPLAEAVRSNLAIALPLLLMHLDLTQHLSDSHNYCALLAAAAETSDWEWIRYLLAMSEMATSAILGYALVLATKADQTQVVLTLLDAGASLNRVELQSVFDRDMKDPIFAYDLIEFPSLIFALWHRNGVLVRALLDHRSVQGHVERFGTFSHCQAMGCAVLWHNDRKIFGDLLAAGFPASSGLVIASKIGDLDLVKYLLEKDRCFYQRGFALDQAVSNGHFSIAQELLNRGVRYFMCYDKNKTLRSVIRHRPDLLPQLMKPISESSPDIHRPYAISVLRVLIQEGREDIVRGLLENERFALPASILLWAAIRLRATKQTIALLLAPSMNFDELIDTRGMANRRDEDIKRSHPERFETLLLAAIGNNDLLLTACLLEQGAEVNCPAIRGLRRTPLQKAAEIGHKAVVELLLTNGANVHAPPAIRGGVTPIQAAAIGGYIGIVELLLRYGEDHRASGARVEGRTALEGAAEHGRFDMVVYLLDLGSYRLDQYKSAAKFAERKGHRAIVGLLVEAMEGAQLLTGAATVPACKFHIEEPTSSNIKFQALLSSIHNSSGSANDGDHILTDADNSENSTDSLFSHGSDYASFEGGTVSVQSEHSEGQTSNDAFHLPFAKVHFGAHSRGPVVSIQATNLQASVEPSFTSDIAEKKFKCKQLDCGFSADRNDTLTRHKATHQPPAKKRKHKCQHCFAVYSRADSLKSHLKHCSKKPTGVTKG